MNPTLKEMTRMLHGITFEPQKIPSVLQAVPAPGQRDTNEPTQKHQLLEYHLNAFDTQCRFFAQADDGSIFGTIKQACETYNHIFSHTLPTSSLSFLNRACGAPTHVNPELAELIETALYYCGKTAGLLDITTGGLEQLWNYHRSTLPAKADIEEALRHVNYQSVHVEGDVVSIDDAQTTLVLGAIAKGYIADELCTLMRSAGITSGVVDLGGNLAAIGSDPEGNPWRFEIPDPTTQKPRAVLECIDESAVTSGTYERFFTANGKRYHHIIDPRTGYPADSDIVGITVVARNALVADAYSTALFIMGSERALAFAEQTRGIEAFIITTNGTTKETSHMASRVVYRS